MGVVFVTSRPLEDIVNIGRPQRIIEVEPVSLPLPEPVTAPSGPAPAEPTPVPAEEPAG